MRWPPVVFTGNSWPPPSWGCKRPRGLLKGVSAWLVQASNSPGARCPSRDCPEVYPLAKAKVDSKLSSRSPVDNPLDPCPTNLAAMRGKSVGSPAKGKDSQDCNRSNPARPAEAAIRHYPVVNPVGPAAFLSGKDAVASKGCSPSLAVLAEAACPSCLAENRDHSVASPKAEAKLANK